MSSWANAEMKGSRHVTAGSEAGRAWGTRACGSASWGCVTGGATRGGPTLLPGVGLGDEVAG
jgi:hypothetical protein